MAAIDSTGYDSDRASTYFGRRCGRKQSRFPKLSAVVDVDSHLFLASVVDRGPKPDDLEFESVARQAHRRHRFDLLLGDVGYDGEGHHVFLDEQLDVAGIMPPTRGRPPDDPEHVPGGLHRSRLHRLWPDRIYGQRWQIETSFWMLKGQLGSKIRARKRHPIDREIRLRVITHNLMILAAIPSRGTFQ